MPRHDLNLLDSTLRGLLMMMEAVTTSTAMAMVNELQEIRQEQGKMCSKKQGWGIRMLVM